MKRLVIIFIVCLSLITHHSSLINAFADPLPKVYDIIMQAGEDYHRVVKLTQGVNGAPVNITGNIYKAQFGPTPGAGSAIFATYSTIVETPSSGEIHLKLSNRQTSALSRKAGRWDLRETGPDGSARYLAVGTAGVRPTITQ